MIAVTRYRQTRYWAVLVDGELLCVCVYKRGADAVAARLSACR